MATEHGIVYQMKKRWPDKEFIIADGCIGCRMHCPYMKMIDLIMVRDALRRGKHEINVPQDVADGDPPGLGADDRGAPGRLGCGARYGPASLDFGRVRKRTRRRLAPLLEDRS